MQQGQVLLGLVAMKETAATDIRDLIKDLNDAGMPSVARFYLYK